MRNYFPIVEEIYSKNCAMKNKLKQYGMIFT